ncbi:hypothetical protein IF2G_02733 [Cordyceps javanica]|nr:hypothetical protein IF2G_02733 [Cordyceps javanica]
MIMAEKGRQRALASTDRHNSHWLRLRSPPRAGPPGVKYRGRKLCYTETAKVLCSKPRNERRHGRMRGKPFDVQNSTCRIIEFEPSFCAASLIRITPKLCFFAQSFCLETTKPGTNFVASMGWGVQATIRPWCTLVKKNCHCSLLQQKRRHA